MFEYSWIFTVPHNYFVRKQRCWQVSWWLASTCTGEVILSYRLVGVASLNNTVVYIRWGTTKVHTRLHFAAVCIFLYASQYYRKETIVSAHSWRESSVRAKIWGVMSFCFLFINVHFYFSVLIVFFKQHSSFSGGSAVSLKGPCNTS